MLPSKNKFPSEAVTVDLRLCPKKFIVAKLTSGESNTTSLEAIFVVVKCKSLPLVSAPIVEEEAVPVPVPLANANLNPLSP